MKMVSYHDGLEKGKREGRGGKENLVNIPF